MNDHTLNEKILSEFYEIITENKKHMFDQIAAQRTKHVTVVLENIYQEHNASAVIRSCDCFGIQELHVIEKNNAYKVQRDIALGAGRWVDMYNYDRGDSVTSDCLIKLKNNGYTIVATSPHATKDIHELDLTKPIALLFGTERKGLSQEIIEQSDDAVKLSMYGFTESFNISVSVALCLQSVRQQLEASNLKWKLSDKEQIELKIKWCRKILNGGEKLEDYFRKKYSERST